jgi:hypothetical protein
MSVLFSFLHAIRRAFYQRFYRVSITPFTAEMLPLVQDFDCGSDPWCGELNKWIKSGEAIADKDALGTQVWLYMRGKIVIGYGSVGTTRRPFNGSWKNVVLIPMVAIQRHFHGRPRWAEKDERYSGQIMNHLLNEALQYRLADLILYVHPQNIGAKKLYTKFGFSMLGPVRGGHEMMGLRLL